MKIYGQTKTSFIDYPDKISTVLFTGGCNFRCGYCHNPELVLRTGTVLEEEGIFEFLRARKKYLDAVCISGGEPTLHEGLYDFIQKVKELKYLVKLDTNGSNSKVLRKLVEGQLIDYIAMDIKAPLARYQEIVNADADMDAIKESIDIIKDSGIDYEFRTTVHKEILEIKDLLQIVTEIGNVERYCIQNFKKTGSVLNDSDTFTPFTYEELEEIRQALKDDVHELIIR